MRKIFTVALYLTLFMLVVSTVANIVPATYATLQGFPSLVTHDFNDVASSLKVQGTVILYEAVNYGGKSIPFSNQWVSSLVTSGWNNIASSLKVDGSVTLYQDTDYVGKTITFTSNSIPDEYIGTVWSANPSLTKNQGKWDARLWHWGLSSLHLEGADSNNYADWSSDGLVSSRAHDSFGDHYVAANFDQGYERSQEWIPNLVDLGWNDKISSLRVQGKVTLYEHINYGGQSKTFGPYQNKDGWISDLRASGWNDKASSIHVEGTVSLYEHINYVGAILTFATPSYQPSLLSAYTPLSITLEGVVYDWYSDFVSTASWTGVKFDVWAVENRESGRKLMMEMYFIRAGSNLLWNPEWARYFGGDAYNYLVAIDAFPQYAQRFIYPGDIARWKIDVKSLLQRGANAHGLDFSKLYITKISFTIESASNIPGEAPACRCKLKKLRLAYTYGGGCPILSVFDGSKYVTEGLLDIHNPYGEDVIKEHILSTTPEQVNHAYLLKLTEHPETHSYIDQVKLYAVLQDGKVVERPLIWAQHSEYGNVLPQLLLSDDWKTETIGADHNGISQTINLRFLALPSNQKAVAFIFQIEGNNMIVKETM